MSSWDRRAHFDPAKTDPRALKKVIEAAGESRADLKHPKGRRRPAVKEWVFLGAGLLIAADWLLMRRGHRATTACEIPAGSATAATACEAASRFSRAVLWISTGPRVVGFIVTFLALPVGSALGWV